jgi:hypothetical protein
MVTYAAYVQGRESTRGHSPAGAAHTSALHLNIDVPLDRLYGICKIPIAVPELGRSAVHAESVTVISDWIATMNGDC